MQMRQCGSRRVPFKADGVQRGTQCLATDVVRPLAAVSAIVVAANEVVGAKGGSFIRKVEVGDKSHPRREGGCTMEAGWMQLV